MTTTTFALIALSLFCAGWVKVMPLVRYLNSVGLERDPLIQAMGLVFMVAMLSLSACLAWTGHLEVASAGASTLAAIPVFVGMSVGQLIRLRLHADRFRRWLSWGFLRWAVIRRCAPCCSCCRIFACCKHNSCSIKQQRVQRCGIEWLFATA